MGYYPFNWKEVSQKAKESYFKEKSAEYYLKKQRSNKKSKKHWHKNLTKEEKDKIKKYQRERYRQLIQYKKEALRSK